MFRKWLATPNDWTLTILRLAAGIMIFPHGLQKTFGWFGGAGFSAQMAGFERSHIPAVFAFLAIMAEFLGGLGLISRPADQESLRGVASCLDQDRLGDPILKALGDHAQAEVVAQPDCGSDDCT